MEQDCSGVNITFPFTCVHVMINTITNKSLYVSVVEQVYMYQPIIITYNVYKRTAIRAYTFPSMRGLVHNNRINQKL